MPVRWHPLMRMSTMTVKNSYPTPSKTLINPGEYSMQRTSFLVGLALATLFVSSNLFAQKSQPNTLSAAEEKAGWKLLFDGKSTKGWRNYKAEGVSDGWKVEDGALVRADKGAGDIITKEQYEGFELSLEYKISKGGNSGIMFHVTETENKPWQTGPEIQVQDNGDGHDPQLAGWLYQLYKPSLPGWIRNSLKEAGKEVPESVDTTKPAGEWNHIYLKVTPQQGIVCMNGVKYYTFQKGSKDWDKRVAASKFSKFPNFGKPTKGHICLQDHNDLVSYRNIKVRVVEPGKTPNPVDGEIAVKPVLAFPKQKWTGWDPVTEDGKVRSIRPIEMTHAHDGTNRMFVATQRGVIHVFKNDPNVEKTTVFLDIEKQVAPYYEKGANEEGLLGLSFHPDYEKNGQFYVYYTAREPAHMSKVSRFKVSKDNPNVADPNSEEVIWQLQQPFPNHNGGSIEFGPDGYLYISLGDGGSGNDPLGNGQNTKNVLGSILRIDVDGKDGDKKYGIPADNPFAKEKGPAPEIFAYGFRNPWRIAFDRKTGHLWMADVGQDLWEEVNIVVNGGNYGWSVRESAHTFGADGVAANNKMVDPIWEYDHEVGRSITGGRVYRGSATPELAGCYIYADYVSGKYWALKYDEAKGKVVFNKSIPADTTLQALGFGEDQNGEVYVGVPSNNGQAIYKFASGK